uniref:CSON009016 protein n=1 Tax=Culicoides sonorensis TaxID=179676 RepID=A0A336M4X1_CULSO
MQKVFERTIDVCKYKQRLTTKLVKHVMEFNAKYLKTNYTIKIFNNHSYEYAVDYDTTIFKDFSPIFTQVKFSAGKLRHLDKIFERTIDVCKYKQRRKSDVILNFLYDFVIPRNDPFRNCPVKKGFYKHRNLTLNRVDLPMIEYILGTKDFDKLLLELCVIYLTKEKRRMISVVNLTYFGNFILLQVKYSAGKPNHLNRIFERTIDVCRYKQRRKSDVIVNFLYDFVIPKKDPYRNCPVKKGFYKHRNLTMNSVELPMIEYILGTKDFDKHLLEFCINYYTKEKRRMVSIVNLTYFGNFLVQFKLKIGSSRNKIMAPMDRTTNLCILKAKRQKSDPFTNLMYDYVIPKNDPWRNCPVKKGIYNLRNLTMNGYKYPLLKHFMRNKDIEKELIDFRINYFTRINRKRVSIGNFTYYAKFMFV